MLFRTIMKMFDDGNVCVTGLRGRGKDMLMSNVVVRRKLPYVANVCYDGSKRAKRSCSYRPFRPLDYDIGNSHENFINGNINSYSFPHGDRTDIYISDAGVYFPSQYVHELDKKYRGFISFMALSRHLGLCNVHCNAQNINRVWTKISEQSDYYINCNYCKVFLGFVFQIVTIYENYDSCVKRVPPFPMKRPLFNPNRIQQYEIAKTNFITTHGKIKRGILFYRNKSKYDTRSFKTMLSSAEVLKRQLKEEVFAELCSVDYSILKSEVNYEKKL